MDGRSVNVEHLWFLDTLVTIRISEADGKDGISILEHHTPHGDSAPLHIHHTEDEVFHILEGEICFKVRDEMHRHGAGEVLLVPKGVPHTYRVESPQGGRWLTVTVRGDFERFVRAMARPAERVALPDQTGEPSPAEEKQLMATASVYGIEIVGPSLH